MKRRVIVLTVFISAALIYGQAGLIDLTGTVINQAYTPVQNLVVGLAVAGIYDTTDENGLFDLFRPATLVAHQETRRVPGLSLEGEKLVLDLPAEPLRVRLDIYTLRGARVGTPFDETFGPGKHRIPIGIVRDGKSASAVYVAALNAGSQTYRYKLVKAGNGRFSLSGYADGQVSTRSQLPKSVQADDEDTLMIFRREELEFKTALTGLVADLTILLDLVPYEILEIAVAQENRYPDEVGQDLDYYPYDLARYLDYLDPTGQDPHDYEAWCSEFLCWAYVAAGYPLSGGREEDWLIGGNTQIRSWFQNNSRFVSKTDPDWDGFVPSPGDFIRYDNEFGGHTGIVRYQEGTTLYTVEGNVSNRCRLRTLSDWKNRADVDGIGMRSGFAESGIISATF